MRGLVRRISAVENNAPGTGDLLILAFRCSDESLFAVGFTGAPGASKSMLINALIRHYRWAGKTVGVMAY